ncbi:MAG: hypothetical protein LBV26_04590 [Bacteroidales bacterium]|nr:hypothetical protein [Bacteroidales bacterium]
MKFASPRHCEEPQATRQSRKTSWIGFAELVNSVASGYALAMSVEFYRN